MKLTPYTISFGEEALEHGLIWKIDTKPTGHPKGRWVSLSVEPEAWPEVMVFSTDFPTGVSVMALLENLKRVRGKT